jgi:hypothetical protein
LGGLLLLLLALRCLLRIHFKSLQSVLGCPTRYVVKNWGKIARAIVLTL